MAENDDSQEKTEEPTSKRREKAREEGQVARSQELTTAASVISVAGFVFLFGNSLFQQLSDRFATGFVFQQRDVADSQLMMARLGSFFVDAFLIISPIFATAFVVALLVSGSLGGYSFSLKAIAPKVSKLNPLNGFKRMFGMRSVVELLKSLGKFLLVGGITYLLVNNYVGELMYASLMNYSEGLIMSGSIVALSFLIATCALIIIALIDVPYQLFEYNKKLKMTKQEIKDEMKDTEGRPEVKRKIREKQREMASMRMLEAIADADVIITNPEHFAIALAYDPTGDMPPQVVAKGADLIAQNIKQRAKEEGVPLFESPILARALYFTTDLNGYIPEALYEAVAQVIAFIFNINSFNRDNIRPQKPNPKVPQHMIFDEQGNRSVVE